MDLRKHDISPGDQDDRNRKLKNNQNSSEDTAPPAAFELTSKHSGLSKSREKKGRINTADQTRQKGDHQCRQQNLNID